MAQKLITATETEITIQKISLGKLPMRIGFLKKMKSNEGIFIHTGCIFRGALSIARINEIEERIKNKEI